ncbi:hypothetical protein B0O80DRAFT_427019 [Mortierella sp. GBAus27b]|nr:hypothetical protein B0O80DRAFT_427019 [Mortierella sp. GBAus27b]
MIAVIAVIAVIDHIKNRPMTKSSVDVIDPKKPFQYIPEALRDRAWPERLEDVGVQMRASKNKRPIEHAGTSPQALHQPPTRPYAVTIRQEQEPGTLSSHRSNAALIRVAVAAILCVPPVIYLS